MTVGLVYNLKPKEVQEERYDVSTGIRRRGNYILDVAGLEVGNYVPSFLPIAADLKTKTVKIVVHVPAAKTIDTSATRIKVVKSPYIEDGIVLGARRSGAVVQLIDHTNADYDEIILAAAFGAEVNTGDTLSEASATGSTTPKTVASLALYENCRVVEGINSVALLMHAFEVEPERLVMSFCTADKANLPHFQFNEQKERTGS